jgi:hypothetical protein
VVIARICDPDALIWPERIFLFVILVLFYVGGGIVLRRRGPRAFARYRVAWIVFWTVSILAMTAIWPAVNRYTPPIH